MLDQEFVEYANKILHGILQCESILLHPKIVLKNADSGRIKTLEDKLFEKLTKILK